MNKRKLENNLLVSIITPSFNQGEFIEETILSVLNQSYKNIEYIIMDGGSTDNTLEILKKYEDKLMWISEKDEGQADAVDKGIRLAKGNIIGWLNSDDTYQIDAIEKVVDFFISDPSLSVLYGNANFIDKDSCFVGKYPTKKFDSGSFAKECYICQPATFFTKDIYFDVNGIDINLQLCLDYDLWIRMSQKTNLIYKSDTLANSRIYLENKTFSRRKEVFSEAIYVVKKQYKFVPFQWVYGFYHHEVFEKRNNSHHMYFYLLYLILKHNWNSPILFLKSFKKNGR